MTLSQHGFDGYAVDSLGHVYSTKYGRERAIKLWENGVSKHLILTMMRDKRKVRMLVHRIVAMAFLGAAPPGKPNVLHRDGNPKNNAVGNLYYGDQSDNGHDMVRHGRCFPKEHPELMPRGDAHPFRRNPALAARGEACGGAKLVANDVVAIRQSLAEGQTLSALARRYGVTVTNIGHIRNRHTWRHVA